MSIKPILSPTAQAMFDKMDKDGEYRDFQIPYAHKAAYDELKRKGYLVPVGKIVSDTTGEHTNEVRHYEFTEDIKADLDGTLYR